MVQTLWSEEQHAQSECENQGSQEDIIILVHMQARIY